MKKNFKLLTIITVAALSILVLMAGCSKQSSMTLENYTADHPEIQEEINSTFKGSGLEGAVKIEGNTIIMDVDISSILGSITLDDSTKEQLKTAFDASFEEAGKELSSALADIEKETKISGVTMKVNVTYGDEVVWENTFSAS